MPEEEQQSKKPRGFAAMTPEQQREIARLGGKAAAALGTAHRWTQGSEEPRIAGRKGGMSRRGRSSARDDQ